MKTLSVLILKTLFSKESFHNETKNWITSNDSRFLAVLVAPPVVADADESTADNGQLDAIVNLYGKQIQESYDNGLQRKAAPANKQEELAQGMERLITLWWWETSIMGRIWVR